VDQGTVLQAYARAWAERDEEAIRSWLGICWSERSTYVNPFTDIVHGIDGLTALILDYPVMFPDVTIRPFGEPRRRHELVAWPWRMSSTCRIRLLGRDFGRELAGWDVVRFDEDGRLADVVAFICGAANDTGDGPLVKCVEEALTAASEPQLTRG
jgi:hypothetical protein